jgi:NAD(P)H-dependent FMN reductase
MTSSTSQTILCRCTTKPYPRVTGSVRTSTPRHGRATIAPYDGYIFVSPEYNHSTSAVLKDALDHLYAEWHNKAAAFAAYGSLSGARAVEHLRLICAELHMATVRQQLAFSLFTDFDNFTAFTPATMHNDSAAIMFAQLESWAGALKALRS